MMPPDLGMLAPPPPLGRLRGMTMLPAAGGRGLVLNGGYRTAGGTHRAVQQVIGLPPHPFGFLAADHAGRLTYAPALERGAVALGFIRQGNAQGGLHPSWVWLFPPADDADAQAARAAFARGAHQIPGKDRMVGLAPGSRRPLTDLRRHRDFDRTANVFRITAPETVLADCRLDGATFVLTPRAGQPPPRSVRLARGRFDVVGAAWNTLFMGAPRDWTAAPATLQVEDCTITNQDPSPRFGGVGIRFAQHLVLRRCLIERCGTGIYGIGPGSLLEDVHIRQCGLGPVGHGDALEVQGIAATEASGPAARAPITVRRFHFSMPSPASPDWDGTLTTALLTISINQQNPRPFAGMTLEDGLFDGGTFCIVLSSGSLAGRAEDYRIGPITISNCFFTRSHAYGLGGDNTIPFRVHPNIGQAWTSITFQNCRWTDSGERIAGLEGVWVPGTGGAPVRAAPAPEGALNPPVSSGPRSR